jgi:GNAT superfamily N-acetyltransferase
MCQHAQLGKPCYDMAMPLPILHTTSQATPETLIRLFHKTEHHWSEHLGEETQLDAGSAFHNAQFPKVQDANRMFDAAIPENAILDQVFQSVDSHYAAHGLKCLSWVMNPSANESQKTPLIDALLSRGFQAHREDILYLQHMPRTAVQEVGGLKIIPARASFRHARDLSEKMVANRAPELAGQLIEASLSHLDDPHYDSLLALKDGTAIAKVGVLAVGEVGRIEPLFVAETHRRQGIGRTMMSRALEICARSLFKHIFLSCNTNNEPAQSLYRTLGFVKIGEIVSYFIPD